MSTIVRLDGFTCEGKGNIIAGSIVDGDVVRIDGKIEQRWTTLAAPPAPTPRVFDWGGFKDYLVGLLGGGDTGTAALQTIVEAARDHAGTATNDKLTRYFYTWFTGSTVFTKAETALRLVPLVATLVVTQNQANAVASNWPAP